MSKIIKFPKEVPVDLGQPAAIPAQPKTTSPKAKHLNGKRFFAGLDRWVWVAVVLVWPILKWIVSIEVFFQALRMVYYWDKPGVYAGWTFMLHFLILTALTYYVSIYKPNGI